eukprot:scaffold11190_cov32-Attheya_sp.AAC.1
MSSPNITSSTMLQSFAPKKEIPLTYGKSTVYVYPSITEGMPNAEKSYAFMMNKSAFATADIKIKTKIQAFANSLNSTPLANVVQAKFIEHATTYITSAGKFTVDSYHGRNRIIIPDCLDVDGDLRPMSGEAAANCRPEGFQYVKLLSDIKFTEVDDKNVQPYPFIFYVRLTMEDITVQDDNQNDINLLTFHGEDEWAATDTPVQDEIDIVLKSQASIRKPFLLAPPSIADVSADASIEVTPGVQGLENKLALEAAWDYITQAVFDKICPNFTQDPAAVIQEITQEQVIPKTGARIALTVEQYHNAILNCANFFPQSGEWEVDVIQDFMTHLSSSIKIQVKAIPFTYISDSSRKAPFQQMIWLQKTFSAASTAEATLDQVRTIAQQEYATHHALHSNIEV